MADPEIKGTFNQEDWQQRYARHFEGIGWTPYEAECAAFNAWEASSEDADPDETACADLSYMAEDGE